jgi:hypothetical protein
MHDQDRIGGHTPNAENLLESIAMPDSSAGWHAMLYHWM